ncbi:MAG: hypothetical protein JWO36_5516, partial [Myxococcales bacterium]|nr:hypothetical protein [Myxococcales bacterium]
MCMDTTRRGSIPQSAAIGRNIAIAAVLFLCTSCSFALVGKDGASSVSNECASKAAPIVDTVPAVIGVRVGVILTAEGLQRRGGRSRHGSAREKSIAHSRLMRRFARRSCELSRSRDRSFPKGLALARSSRSRSHPCAVDTAHDSICRPARGAASGRILESTPELRMILQSIDTPYELVDDLCCFLRGVPHREPRLERDQRV